MSIENKYTLKPALEEVFDGIIWKLETDAEEPLIAVECRNVEKHTSSISLFDFSTGICHFKDLLPQDSWNWNLDKVYKGHVFLHGYKSSGSPEHLGIICINNKGVITWQTFNKTLHSISEEGLIAYTGQVEPRQLELLSLENGTTLHYGLKHYTAPKVEIVFPQPFLEKEIHLPDNHAGPVLKCVYKNKVLLSYHTKQSRDYTQHLLVFDAGAQVLNIILEQNIPKLNPEAFFIQHSHLVCIRNRGSEIISYLV